MSRQLIWAVLFLCALGVLIMVAVWLHKKMRLANEQSRKFLHVSGGLLCLFLPVVFTSHWWVLLLASVAFAILFLTYITGKLPAVHLTKRKSVGSVLFPIPVYACFLLAELQHNNLLFYLPVTLLTVSDTAAETGGSLWGKKSMQFFNGQKTLIGTICFLLTAIPVCAGWLGLAGNYTLLYTLQLSCIIAVAAAIAELVTLHGWDNITVPAVTVLLLLKFG